MNIVYQPTTSQIYRPPHDNGHYNPLSEPTMQALYNEQTGQTEMRLKNGHFVQNNKDCHRPKRPSLCKVMTVVSLLILISVSISCGVMMLLFNYSDIFQMSLTREAVCVPCSALNSNIRKVVIVKKSGDGNGGQDCCMISAGDLEKILNPVRRNTSRDAFAFPNASNGSFHAFLKAKEGADQTYEGLDVADYEKVSGWTTNLASAFSRSRIQLFDTKDEIEVKDAGIYVIYSRLEFNGPVADAESVSSLSISTPVWFGQQIMQEKKNEPLLEDSLVKTCVSDEGGQLPCYTSQLFAVLNIGKGSKLSVEAKPVNLISLNHRNSYFGLFKID